MSMIDSNKRNIKKCAEAVITDFNDKQISLLNTLQKLTKEMVMAEQQLIYQQIAFSEAEEAISKLTEKWTKGDTKSNMQEYLHIHSDTIKRVMDEQQKLTMRTISDNPDVQYLDKLIKEQEKLLRSKAGSSSKATKSLRRSSKLDLEVLSSYQELNLIDPLTKKNMVEPVKHTKCGHVYDKASILQMIKTHEKKGGFKCPYMGCACREAIEERNLEVAVDYLTEINRRNGQIGRPANPSKFLSS